EVSGRTLTTEPRLRGSSSRREAPHEAMATFAVMARSSRRLVAEILLAGAPAAPTITHVSGWEKATAIGTLVGGVGAGLAAFFAWRAARTSAQTSRDATDALAASLKPQVHLMVTQFGAGESVVARA